MQRVFLEELLEHWRKGELTLKELIEAWTSIGLTPEQLVAQLLPMLLAQAQQIRALERRVNGAASMR